MKSIEFALQRCDEIGDCMVWNLTANSQGLPITWHNGKPGQSVPRIVFAMHHGWNIEDLGRLVVWAGCRTKGCINPEHLCCGTKKQLWAWRRKEGIDAVTPSHRAAMTIAARARPAVKGSMEKARAVRAMRAEGKSLVECAREHGMSTDMASRIALGQNWREAVSGASVFNL